MLKVLCFKLNKKIAVPRVLSPSNDCTNGKPKGSHDDDDLCHCTDHGGGVSLTECWGDTTTGHLMCECPVHRPGSHNRSGVPDTWSRSRSQRLSRSRRQSGGGEKGDGGAGDTEPQQSYGPSVKFVLF